MQIKDVEIMTGMPRSNIRFYEKEGLLNNTLRNDNNYRKYTQEDVLQLRRIKILRLLEVPMEDIRENRDDKEKLNQFIQERMEALQTSVDDLIGKSNKKE